MLGTIFLIMSIILFLLSVMTIWKHRDGSDLDYFVFPGLLIIIVLGLNLFPFIRHINYTTKIEAGASFIQIREDSIARIEEELKSVPQQTALMNADSPVKSLIEAKSEYLEDLTSEKIEIEQYKLALARMKQGPSSWIYWFIKE